MIAKKNCYFHIKNIFQLVKKYDSYDQMRIFRRISIIFSTKNVITYFINKSECEVLILYQIFIKSDDIYISVLKYV